MARSNRTLKMRIDFQDTPRDLELSDYLVASHVRAHRDLKRHVKYLLEVILGLAPAGSPASLSELGLEQWPPRLVEAILLEQRLASVEKHAASLKAIAEERGRVLPFPPVTATE